MVKHKRDESEESRKQRNYGYNDPELVLAIGIKWNAARAVGLLLALAVVFTFWYALNQKLIFGGNWLSETYDNVDWRTNEGNLHTYGAWDFETHVWKTIFIMENFPNFHWNPYWYLGMPLLKYYQSGFYFVHWLFIELTGLHPAKAALVLVIFGHLLATLLTFLLCYKVSRKIWVSALCSIFLLTNTFISLRTYGWEPITVVFLFLYPLGLMLFLKDPLHPFRFWLIVVLGLSYLSHPLLFFSLCMAIGLYLLSVSLSRKRTDTATSKMHYITAFFALVICSILLGSMQFIPQISYKQATSGAHMGVKYLPYYQVPPNIITPVDFFFDAGNLKGPGPVIMIAFLLILIFWLFAHRNRLRFMHSQDKKQATLIDHEIARGFAFTLLLMVVFYYLELYNIFPMNTLRSIQYHRIIPEFIITAAVLIAAMSNVIHSRAQKAVYYTLLIAFVMASGIILYFVQLKWASTDDISQKQEFIYDRFEGRISMPYTDQSLAVRNSFTKVPQVYGYYEQGITNPYNDELFSVSSGFHNANLTLLYLKAANVARLYVNMEEGDRDLIMRSRLNGTLKLVHANSSRYAYYNIPLHNPSFAQAVDIRDAIMVQKLAVGCRTIFQEKYCGSVGEEFVSKDIEEIKYLDAYVQMTDKPYTVSAEMEMLDPQHYRIKVANATENTAVIIKMTYDEDFAASMDGKDLQIIPIGPNFMMVHPARNGTYKISLEYRMSKYFVAGLIGSVTSLIGLILFFALRNRISSSSAWRKIVSFDRGDMYKDNKNYAKGTTKEVA